MSPSARLGLLAAALVVSLALSFGVGSSDIDLLAVLNPSPLMWQVRLPRVLLGGLCGAALASAGMVLQAVLHSPLADPYIVGASGGAALGGVIAVALGVGGALAVPSCAFVGALVFLAVLLGLARAAGRSEPATLLLAGAALNAMGGAGVTVVSLLVDPGQARSLAFWLTGAIGVEAPATLTALAAYVALGLAALWHGRGALDLLALGDEQAAALGLAVAPARRRLLGSAALLVGATVALCGMVGFVGLVVPHLMRPLVGARHARLLPACALAGASLLLLCDATSRGLFYLLGAEVPAGALTAACGGPFFLARLAQGRRL